MATQKTLTVNGYRYTGKQIAKMFDPTDMTQGDDYIIRLGDGQRFFGNYRKINDAYYMPICMPDEANAIALMPDDGSYHWSKWIEL